MKGLLTGEIYFAKRIKTGKFKEYKIVLKNNVFSVIFNLVQWNVLISAGADVWADKKKPHTQ